MTCYEIISTILSVIGIGVTGSFAWSINEIEKKNSKREHENTVAADEGWQPTLNFISDFLEWKIINVGGSTANQVRFCEHGEDIWQPAMIGYSIPAGLTVRLVSRSNPSRKVIRFAGALAATWIDAVGRQYLVICRGDTNTVWMQGDKDFDTDLVAHLHNNPERRTDLGLESI